MPSRQHSNTWDASSPSWDSRNSILQYTLMATQEAESPARIPHLIQTSPPYGNFHPNVIQSPLLSPGFDSAGSLLHDQPFSTSSSFVSASEAVAGDYFAFPVTTPPLKDSQVPDDFSSFIDSDSYPSPPSSSTDYKMSSPASKFSTKVTKSSPKKSRTKAKSPPLKTRDSVSPAPSAEDELAKAARQNHTAVERCYRNRLNDKIDALAQHLFALEPSDPSVPRRKANPPKCLVISRARERLEELERTNEALQNNAEALKQQIAVLNHLVAILRDEKSSFGSS